MILLDYRKKCKLPVLLEELSSENRGMFNWEVLPENREQREVNQQLSELQRP
jgi:hypothetical protein